MCSLRRRRSTPCWVGVLVHSARPRRLTAGRSCSVTPRHCSWRWKISAWTPTAHRMHVWWRRVALGATSPQPVRSCGMPARRLARSASCGTPPSGRCQWCPCVRRGDLWTQMRCSLPSGEWSGTKPLHETRRQWPSSCAHSQTTAGTSVGGRCTRSTWPWQRLWRACSYSMRHCMPWHTHTRTRTTDCGWCCTISAHSSTCMRTRSRTTS